QACPVLTGGSPAEPWTKPRTPRWSSTKSDASTPSTACGIPRSADCTPCLGGRMRISLGDVSLWFDVSGPSVIPHGDTTIERPVLVVVHGGPGLDHMIRQAGRCVVAPCARLCRTCPGA